jgi:O-antigen ligase
MDPNGLAGCLSLGLLAVAGLAYRARKNALPLRLCALPVLAMITISLLRTGSRGGLIALGVGFLAFLVGDSRLWTRPRNVLILLLGFGAFVWGASHSYTVRTRFQESIESRTMTLRERSFPLAWEMFLDRPLTGWGPVTNTDELGARLAHPSYPRMDTHNLVLYVLTATGVLGAIPFFWGTGLCVWTAWRARRGPQGALAFAMIATTLMADMSVSGLDWKHHWLVMAFALASRSAPLRGPIRYPRRRARDRSHPAARECRDRQSGPLTSRAPFMVFSSTRWPRS